MLSTNSPTVSSTKVISTVPKTAINAPLVFRAATVMYKVKMVHINKSIPVAVWASAGGRVPAK